MAIIEKITQEDSGIYRITNLSNNKVYIGSSLNITRRIKDHLYKLGLGKHHSVLLQRAWDKYGWEYFDIDILESCDKNLLQDREQYYLDLYESYSPRKGYNISKDTLCFGRGLKHSIEWKQKMSERQMGHVGYNFSHTEEAKEKIRLAQVGKKYTQEQRGAISKRMMGNKNGIGNKGPHSKVRKICL